MHGELSLNGKSVCDLREERKQEGIQGIYAVGGQERVSREGVRMIAESLKGIGKRG